MNALTRNTVRVTLEDAEVIGLLDMDTGLPIRKLKKSDGPQTFAERAVRGITWLVLLDGSAGNSLKFFTNLYEDALIDMDPPP